MFFFREIYIDNISSVFQVFQWLDFQRNVPFTHDCIEKSVEYLHGKGVVFDETKLFNQTMNLARLIEQKQKKDNLFFNQCCNDKICKCFLAKNNNIGAYSEILKIVEFFFSIPGHNANCERIFSLVNSQWTDERNRLLVKTVQDLVSIKFNFNELNCKQFYEYLVKPENNDNYNYKLFISFSHTSVKDFRQIFQCPGFSLDPDGNPKKIIEANF